MVKLTLVLLLAFAGVAGAAPASPCLVAADVTAAPVALASVSGAGGALGR